MGKGKRTHQGTAKRIGRTGGGRLVRGRQQAGHLMVKKRPKRRRDLGRRVAVHPADAAKVRRLLGA
ncbi:MAG: 50S ribosomal protein L35 [Armatimonadetes bacterium]|nr:50S ribosomal protein L35 [Armatimonadota bacterium]